MRRRGRHGVEQQGRRRGTRDLRGSLAPQFGRRLGQRLGVGLLLAAAMAAAGPAGAIALAAPFDADYTFASLGTPPALDTGAAFPGPLGGIAFLDQDTLLVGGAANTSDGALYAVGVTRDADGHIDGYSGPPTLWATAPWIDGGVAFGPGGVLFFTGFPTHELGQILPGSSAPDKTVDLAAAGLTGSVGALAFVPAGFPGAGQLKIVSYGSHEWYSVGLSPDGAGTFDVSSASLELTLPDFPGPEGIAYILAGNPGFAVDSVLVSEWDIGRVSAFEIDANGDPIVATRRTFLEDLIGAEGALVDPVTGDFLFSTFGGGDQIIVVRGFTRVPAPSLVPLVASGALPLLLAAQRRRRPLPAGFPAPPRPARQRSLL